MLPTPAPDDATDASFLGPSRAPTQKVHMGSPEAPERAAQEEQPASQPGNANATKRRKIAAGTKQQPSPQRKTDRTTAERSA